MTRAAGARSRRARVDRARARALPDGRAARGSTRTTGASSAGSPGATSARSSASLNAKGFLGALARSRLAGHRGRRRSSARSSTTPARLAEAADGILDEREQRLLRDGPSGRSAGATHDIPLVDEARALLAGRRARFGHVIVDEAQDLTPMQLRMVGAARARGLGDDPRRHRAGDRPRRLRPLGRRCWRTSTRRRTPRSPSCATPTACPPRSWSSRSRSSTSSRRMSHRLSRSGRAPPLRAWSGSRRATCSRPRFAEALALAGEDGLLAVILPDALVPELAGRLRLRRRRSRSSRLAARRASSSTTSSSSSRPLIAEGATGLRDLYVALTRPTRTLVVVHARPLPAPLTGWRAR